MPKVKISEYSATANSNTDVASINIDEGCAPSGINNAIRAVMGHLKDFQQGTNGDPFNGPVNGTVGATTPSTGAFTTLSATGNVTLGDASTDTLNVGNGGLIKDASGNVGLGVTPPTSTDAGNITIKGGSTLNFSTASGNMAANATFNSGWKYIATAAAVKYTQSGAEHQWLNAASGTAGNAITFTQAMTLDASGNLLLGTTTLTAITSGIANLNLGSTSATTSGGIAYQISGATAKAYDYVESNVRKLQTASGVSIAFIPAGTEAARIDTSGNLLVGATTAYAKLKVGLTSSATTPIVNVGSFGAGGVISLGSVANNSEQVYLGTGDTNGGGIAAGIGFMREASGWNSALSFYTNNVTSGPNGVSAITERMRLDSSGNLLVGTTSASFGEKLSVQSTSSGTNIAYLNYTYTDDRANTVIQHSRATGATSAQMVLFRNASSSQVGLISSTGSATTYGTSSDYRLKENVQPMVGALSKVAALNPVTYTWKADGSASEGFIAHELQAIVPDAVVGEKDAVNEDGSIKPQSIDTSFLVATLTAAIKEQQAIIQSLTARITALESA